MTNLKFNFMEGLILTKDGEMLDQTINSILGELDNEGFTKTEIEEFIYERIKRHLSLVNYNDIVKY